MHQRTDTHITEIKPATQKCNIKKEKKALLTSKMLAIFYGQTSS